MADTKTSALASLGTPVGADYVFGVLASGPTDKKLLVSDLRDYTNMVQATGTDANTTMAVNTMYVVDMSAWATADRTYTLPATAAVGDRVGVMVTAGDATHELILTAGTGDTLNGVAGGTEWSRLFITNEVVIMRCVTANSAWVVEQDGRIVSTAALTRTTAQTLTHNLFSKINVATSEYSVGDVGDTTNSRIHARRAGKYLCGGFCRLDLNDAKSIVVGLAINGTVVSRGQAMSALAAGTVGVSALCPLTMDAGQYLELQVYHDHGSNRDTSTIADSVPRVYFSEIL